MYTVVPLTSLGLLESIWLIGGVFSALKAFGASRSDRTQTEDDVSAKPPEQEVAGASADRSPVPPGAREANSNAAPKEAEAAASSRVQTEPPLTTSDSGTDRVAADDASAEDLGLQILVAEDNPINRKVMQLLLRRMGYEADIAMDGEQAVEMAIAKPYDAILMDLHMPRMGGIEATEAIVARLVPPPRVVAVTADVTQQARTECQRVGMVAYLTKPVDSNLLRHELKEAEAHRATIGSTG